ncbi:hypothetical protein [Plantibacter sp. RU18]|uniref:hypothetical protein n=1 Tax=Plantibacter sp. RU18 TaxID=3158143 RepID=UPI003D360037
MSWKKQVAGLGTAAVLAVSVVLGGGLSATAAEAPELSLAGTEATENRIIELVAAYDRSTKQLDLSEVSTETLASDEGNAFVAAVSPARSDPASASAAVEAGFVALRQALIASGEPMTRGTDDDPSALSFALASGVTITYPSATGARVSGGADPWPYVQLTGAEQQAMVTGASATLVAAICALLGPETAGIGCGVGAAVIGTIVGIIVANGVCPNDKEMRIYPLAGTTGFSCQ